MIDDITLGPYSLLDAEHLDPHIAGNDDKIGSQWVHSCVGSGSVVL